MHVQADAGSGSGTGTVGRLHWTKGGQEKMWEVGAEEEEGRRDRGKEAELLGGGLYLES